MKGFALLHSLLTPLLLLATLCSDCTAQTATKPHSGFDPYFIPIEGKTNPYLARVILRNMLQDKSGAIWFATFGGPVRYDGKSFTNLAEEVGLPNTRIFSLLEDKAGNMWFGAIRGGVSRYDGKSFELASEKPPSTRGARLTPRDESSS